MATKGTIAKQNVVNTIAKAFGSDYIGEFEKKLYIWADDGGQRIQVSIALTCPKVYRGVEETDTNEMNFEETAATTTPAGFKPAEITEQEQETLANLMAKLGF